MSSQSARPDSVSAPLAVSRNPATDELIATYAGQTAQQIEQLLEQNAAAFRIWRATPLRERVAAYRRLAVVLRQRSDNLSALISAEMGNTLQAARAEVEKCAVTLEWLAENGPAVLADEPVAVDNDDRVYVSWLPIGTVLAVMPWNFPLWQVIRASGPIMLSGNGFILKHAPNVIGSAYALQDAYEAAGFPVGLFTNLIADNDTVARVIEDDRVAAVTLTGSLRAGSAVAAIAGKALKKSLLELGGSDAFIVLADADIDAAVKGAIAGRFMNNGQLCISAKRIIVEAAVFEQFSEKFVSAVKAMKIGDPREPGTWIGPMARYDLRDELDAQVQATLKEGATLLVGGHALPGEGNYYAPTVLSDVKPGMTSFDQELFGPVASLIVADDAAHAVAMANDSEFGLGGSLWSRDLDRAQRLASQIETGGVFINSPSFSDPRVPIGGVKKSGFGRELSHFGLREFTNAQTVWVES